MMRFVHHRIRFLSEELEKPVRFPQGWGAWLRRQAKKLLLFFVVQYLFQQYFLQQYFL